MFALRVGCYSVMAICLIVEGLLLAAFGFPFWLPLPSDIFAIGCVWVITCIAVIYEPIRSRPIFIFLAACLLFLVSAVTMWRYSSEEKTLVWFLYQHCLELALIIASLVLYLASNRRQTIKFRSLP